MEPRNDMKTGDFASMRKAMIDSQLRTNAVTDLRVLDAMGRVPREDHVPAAYRAAAYADLMIPLGEGRAINPPMVTGRLLNEAQIGANDSVLIVGPGTGYVTAVVHCLTGSVTTVDAGTRDFDGPFDVIVIDGAVEHVPDALIAALKPNGRLVSGIVEGGVTRLAIGRKGGSGFGLIAFADADVVVLPEFSQPRVFAF
jgi:protein-L-isoaspartate(D-aspartate) O-methyltransferase